MDAKQIVAALEQLARSQGSYGRLLDDLRNDPIRGKVFINHLAHQNFNDVVDLVLYLEG